MNRSRFIILLLAAPIIAFAATRPLGAQVAIDIPLIVSDHGDGAAPGIDTLHFGVHPAATNGRDVGLGEDEQPPAPPEGVFDARWINVGSSNNFGQGVKRNFRVSLNTAQIDTFRVKVQPGFKPGGSGYPMTLTWPDLSKSFTAAGLRFVDGDGTPTTHDMMADQSFTFTNPSSVTSTITIITAGPKGSADVSLAESMLNLELLSTPNPVRRADGARVSYNLPFAAHVSVKLYDALGQVVETLVDGHQEPSRYTFGLATGQLPAGSYFCTITAGQFTMVRPITLVD